MEKRTDILIVGGGSAGFGAAYRILKDGKYSLTLVEQNPGLGGTSTFGGVNCWEPGYGGNGVHHILAKELQESDAGFVGETQGTVTDQTPWGISVKSKDPYEETLERSFRSGPEQRRFHFEPGVMDNTMRQLLKNADTEGRASYYYESSFEVAEVSNGRIASCLIDTPDGKIKIIPKIVLDCSGDIVVARAAGCSYSVGEDSCQLYAEPNAPEQPCLLVNGITQVFRVTPCDENYVEEIPEEYSDVDLTEWLEAVNKTNRPLSCFNFYPNGDININMLPTLPGECWLNMPHEEVRHIAQARVYAYWNWVQTQKHFTGYKIKEIFPMLGIRESYRLNGKYVLTEQDLNHGFSEALGKERTIAFSDHPADIHGSSNKTGGMTMFHPYGIPYECLLPKEINNLIVSGRGASFSHIAASSVRLSRTMIALGEAAGEAAVQCIDQNISPAQVNVNKIRKKLNII